MERLGSSEMEKFYDEHQNGMSAVDLEGFQAVLGSDGDEESDARVSVGSGDGGESDDEDDDDDDDDDDV